MLNTITALSEAEEEIADIATLDSRKAEMAQAALPDLPAEVSALLLQSHSRLSALRLWRAMSAADLARHALITEPDLACIERNPDLADAALCARLAAALAVPEGWIAG